MKAMADRSRGHREAAIKRKKLYKIVGDKHEIVAACGQAAALMPLEAPVTSAIDMDVVLIEFRASGCSAADR